VRGRKGEMVKGGEMEEREETTMKGEADKRQ
jgi:hypothetical protein